MTQKLKNERAARFMRLCELLPTDTHWDDPITPDLVEHIARAAQPPAAEGATTVAQERLRLVPILATAEMLIAGSVAIGMEPLPAGGEDGYPITGEQSTMRKCYEAMIAAAPASSAKTCDRIVCEQTGKCAQDDVAKGRKCPFTPSSRERITFGCGDPEWQSRHASEWATEDAGGEEPVAWLTEDGRIAKDETKRCMPSASRENFKIPLYTRPAPANKAVGLTEEQILAIAWKYHYDEPGASGYDFGTRSLLEFARALLSRAKGGDDDRLPL